MVSKDNTILQVKVSKADAERLSSTAKDLNISKSALMGLILTSVLTYEGGKLLGDVLGNALIRRDGSNG